MPARRPNFGAQPRATAHGDEAFLRYVLSLNANKVSWDTLDSLSPELRALINEFGEVDVAQVMRMLKSVDPAELFLALEKNRRLREKRRWEALLSEGLLSASRARTRGGVGRLFRS